jgi:hypothetical protein
MVGRDDAAQDAHAMVEERPESFKEQGMAWSGRAKAYGRNAWIILLASAVLGIFGGVSLMVPSNPTYQLPSVIWIIRAWGITWIGFNILALVLIVGPYRRGERWAWYTLWLMPLLLVGYFVLSPELTHSLVLAILTAALGLLLPYRRYFPDAHQQPSGVGPAPENPSPEPSEE